MQSDSLVFQWRDRIWGDRTGRTPVILHRHDRGISRVMLIFVLPFAFALRSETVVAQMASASSTVSAASSFRTDPASPPAFVDVNDPARYARYAPSFCDQINGRSGTFAASARVKTWRDRWPETVATREADSVYNAAAMQAGLAELRACLKPFVLANASPYQVWSAGRGWVMLKEEAKANEAFTEFLKSQAQAPVEVRAWWLQQLVGVYAGAGPSGLRTAFAYLARLDSLGEPALGFRIAARNTLYKLGAATDSIRFMREQATAARTLSLMLTGDRLREWLQPTLGAVANLADVDYREGKAAVAKDSLEKATKVYRPLDFMLTSAALEEPLAAASVVAMGAVAPEPKAMFIYYPGQKTSEKTFRDSLKGKPTLYIQLMDSRLIGQLDFGLYALAARVHRQFGDRVNIVAIGTTRGTYAHRLVKDTVEAEQLRVLAHDYLRLPVTLAIFSSQVTGSDEYGRVIRSSNPTVLRPIVLADKRGVIRDFSRAVTPVRTMNMIAELLKP